MSRFPRRFPAGPVPPAGVTRVRPMGLSDPAYVADTPHDLWVAIQGQERMRSTASAAELEAYVRAAPDVDELLAADPFRSRERYDGGGRRLALLMLQHLERHPQDARLPKVIKREVAKAHPELLEVGLSTSQWLWALSAAQRIYDGHQVDG